jgi:hypothetical protein
MDRHIATCVDAQQPRDFMSEHFKLFVQQGRDREGWTWSGHLGLQACISSSHMSMKRRPICVMTEVGAHNR